MKIIGFYIILSIFLFALHAQIKVNTQPVEYKQGDIELKGMLAYDPLLKSIRPGILVIHDRWGINPFIVERIEELAKLGYIAFAVDMFGNGLVETDIKKAKKLTKPFYEDRLLMRERAARGLEVLLQNSKIDRSRIAAIGYGFGGTAVLELARGGVEIRGVVSFYGKLDTPNPDDAFNIKNSVLIIHGADDPNISAEEMADFQKEMKQANIDWTMYIYGNAVSSFSDVKAGDDKSTGIAYNYWADKRSWEALKSFFLLLLQ
jgi:dienelactone hydrolase